MTGRHHVNLLIQSTHGVLVYHIIKKMVHNNLLCITGETQYIVDGHKKSKQQQEKGREP